MVSPFHFSVLHASFYIYLYLPLSLFLPPSKLKTPVTFTLPGGTLGEAEYSAPSAACILVLSKLGNRQVT